MAKISEKSNRMKLLIETWARIEAVVEAETADEAYSQLKDHIDGLVGRRSKDEKVHIERSRADSPIRCYDLNTRDNVSFSWKPSYVTFTKDEILPLIESWEKSHRLFCEIAEKTGDPLMKRQGDTNLICANSLRKLIELKEHGKQ